MGRLYLILGVAALLLVSFPVISGNDAVPVTTGKRVLGEKLDSRLGSMPPYEQWVNHPTLHVLTRTAAVRRVPGEKLDSGLGDLHAVSGMR